MISATLGNGSKASGGVLGTLVTSISSPSGSRNRSATDFRLGVAVAVAVRFGSSVGFFASLRSLARSFVTDFFPPLIS